MNVSIHAQSPPKIVDAEISEGGVKVVFDDGESVVFSSSFLYHIYLEAQKTPGVQRRPLTTVRPDL